MEFAIISEEGAFVEGLVFVRHAHKTTGGFDAFALIGAPVGSMLTAAGVAWARFEHVEGAGDFYVCTEREARSQRKGMELLGAGYSTAAFGPMDPWCVPAPQIGVLPWRPASACWFAMWPRRGQSALFGGVERTVLPRCLQRRTLRACGLAS
jgi:hypothetical protein